MKTQEFDKVPSTSIPNFIIEILKLEEVGVYFYIKKIQDEFGICDLSMKDLAKTIGMGQTKLREVLKKLSDPNFCFAGNVLEIIKRRDELGSCATNITKVIEFTDQQLEKFHRINLKNRESK